MCCWGLEKGRTWIAIYCGVGQGVGKEGRSALMGTLENLLTRIIRDTSGGDVRFVPY